MDDCRWCHHSPHLHNDDGNKLTDCDKIGCDCKSFENDIINVDKTHFTGPTGDSGAPTISNAEPLHLSDKSFHLEPTNTITFCADKFTISDGRVCLSFEDLFLDFKEIKTLAFENMKGDKRYTYKRVDNE